MNNPHPRLKGLKAIQWKFIISRSGHLSELERHLRVKEHINMPPSVSKKNISASEHVHLAKQLKYQQESLFLFKAGTNQASQNGVLRR